MSDAKRKRKSSSQKPPRTEKRKLDEPNAPKRQALAENQLADEAGKSKQVRGVVPLVDKFARDDTLSDSSPESPPTTIIASKPARKDSGKERQVRFSDTARVKLIPSDQLPPRPMHMDRSVSNPKRRLWVLYRLCQIGGRYYPQTRNKKETDFISPGTRWPSEWGEPPTSTPVTSIKEPEDSESSSVSVN